MGVSVARGNSRRVRIRIRILCQCQCQCLYRCRYQCRCRYRNRNRNRYRYRIRIRILDAILTLPGELLTPSWFLLGPYSLRNHDNVSRRSGSIRPMAATCGSLGNDSRDHSNRLGCVPSPWWTIDVYKSFFEATPSKISLQYPEWTHVLREHIMLALGIIMSFSISLISLIAILEKRHPNRIRRNPIA